MSSTSKNTAKYHRYKNELVICYRSFSASCLASVKTLSSWIFLRLTWYRDDLLSLVGWSCFIGSYWWEKLSWLKSYIMFVLATRLVCNVVIYLTAMKRLLEFQGYQPRPFPLQPPPRKMIPEPRRLSLPPNFSAEWKNIGSKRQKIGLKKQKFSFINSEDRITNCKIFQQSLSMPAIETWAVKPLSIHLSLKIQCSKFYFYLYLKFQSIFLNGKSTVAGSTVHYFMNIVINMPHP